MAIARNVGRWLGAVAVIVAAVAYVVVVLNGTVPSAQKLGWTDLALVILAALIVVALLAPEGLRSVSRVHIGNVLDLELRELRRGQEAQKQELDDLRFALTLLVVGPQRDALNDLERAGGREYTGNHEIRTDLRRLAAMGLVRRRPGRHIGELADGKRLNIADVLELTADGRRYLERVRTTVERQN